MSSAQELRRREKFTVVRDGEEIEVFNEVNVKQVKKKRVNIPAAVIESFDEDPEIGAGGTSRTPDAVTHWVADDPDYALGIDPEEYGIEVIDPADDDVEVV